MWASWKRRLWFIQWWRVSTHIKCILINLTTGYKSACRSLLKHEYFYVTDVNREAMLLF